MKRWRNHFGYWSYETDDQQYGVISRDWSNGKYIARTFTFCMPCDTLDQAKRFIELHQRETSV